MSIPVFSPITKPDSEQEVNAKPKVQEVVFNDGYIQTAAIGINNDMRTYNPVWTNAYYAEATYIINFLTAKGAGRNSTGPRTKKPNNAASFARTSPTNGRVASIAISTRPSKKDHHCKM